MGKPTIKPTPLHEVFKHIRDAQRFGRRIVPLLGSGVSVDAGIPKSVFLADYLIAVHAIARDRFGWQVHEYLGKWKWPDRNDVCEDWTAFELPRAATDDPLYPSAAVAKRFEEAAQQLIRNSVLDELKSNAPLTARVARALHHELPKAATERVRSDFRSLLATATQDDSNLIDAFFDHFIRGRQPATTHQFVAFLARLLRIDLILTTNFDSLAETALRNEGLQPTVYEVARDSDVPSAILVRNQSLSVIKLHGGTHALRTGHRELDEPLPVAALHQIRQYLEPHSQRASAVPGLPALMLVLGYSGTDRRVMDIVVDHASSRHPDVSPNVIWVSRKGTLHPRLEHLVRLRRDNKQRDPVISCAYTSGHLFLQEVYKVLQGQYAVSRTSYHTLVSVPRRPDTVRNAPDVLSGEKRDDALAAHLPSREARDAGYVILYNEQVAHGTSSVLFRATQEYEQTHEILWIDACDLTTRAMLMEHIEEEFRRLDPGCVRLSRPLFLQDVDYLSSLPVASREPRSSVTPPQAPPGERRNSPVGRRHSEQPHAGVLEYSPERSSHEERLAAWWITRAMQRGNYVVAVDSLGEFGNRHPSVHSQYFSDLDSQSQHRRVLRLFGEISRHSPSFGRSLMMVAMTPRSRSDGQDASDSFESHLHLANNDLNRVHAHRVDVASLQPSAGAPKRPSPVDDQPGGRAERAVAEVIERLGTTAGLAGADAEQPQAMDVGLVLAIASLFRRPRSRVALRVAMKRYLELLCAGRTEDDKHLGKAFRPLLGRLDDPGYFDRLLLAACEVRLGSGASSWRLMAHLEGGFYWMHLESRDEIYRHLTGAAVQVNGRSAYIFPLAILAELYNRLALFGLDDVYERSRDLSAFIEYAHYRFLSIDHYHRLSCDSETDKSRREECGARWKTLLVWYIGALEGERDTLTARGKLTPLILQLRTLIRFLVQLDRGEDRTFVRDMAARVLNLSAAVLSLSGRHRHALVYRLWHANLLATNARRDPAGQPVAGTRRAAPCGPPEQFGVHLPRLDYPADDIPRHCGFLYDSLRYGRRTISGLYRRALNGACDERSLVSIYTTVQDVCRLLVDAMVLDEPMWQRAMTNRVPEELQKVVKLRLEARSLSNRTLATCLRQLGAVCEGDPFRCDPVLMKLQECRALIEARRLHLEVNQRLSEVRFGWLLNSDVHSGAPVELASEDLRDRFHERVAAALDWLRHGAATPTGRCIESFLHVLRGASEWYAGAQGWVEPGSSSDLASQQLVLDTKEAVERHLKRRELSQSVAELEFHRAQAVLSRPAGSLEYAATTLCDLVHAEAVLHDLRVRLRMYASVSRDSCPDAAAKAIIVTDGERLRHKARGLLGQAREAMDQACLENKWRSFYFYLCATCSILEAEIARQGDLENRDTSRIANGGSKKVAPSGTAERQAGEVYHSDEVLAKLRVALRETVSGLTICGMHSDQYQILQLLLRRIREFGTMHCDAERWAVEEHRYEFFFSEIGGDRRSVHPTPTRKPDTADAGSMPSSREEPRSPEETLTEKGRGLAQRPASDPTGVRQDN